MDIAVVPQHCFSDGYPTRRGINERGQNRAEPFRVGVAQAEAAREAQA